MLVNATPLELGWTATAAIGAVAWFAFLYLVVCDERRRRRTRVNGMVKLDIVKGIACGLILGTKAAGYTVAGLLAMSTPPAPGAAPASAGSMLILVILIGNNVLLTLLALYFHANRRAANLEVEKGEQEMARGERRDRRHTDTHPQDDGALDVGPPL